jgi:class 3 adenylate cyclase/tetratricopeptide (TPR) repeat protein
MICPRCGFENPAGRRFCSRCGSSLALSCPSCGAGVAAEDRFCGECGAALGDRVAPGEARPVPPPTPRSGVAEAERRLVSVLFADLVGFTTLSERRDAEEVRELLTRYFDTARRLVGRYGGVVEKFIGDAVMAVWGTPTAQEDDAERAVRAALDLAGAVAVLGAEVGAPDLQARVGVLTGEAVTLGAWEQGMVAGDLVNTASRVQATAEPGTVLVGEATRRATQAAILYQDAGAHTLKGKAEPVPLWRAVRVVAGRGGALKSSGLEAPFVGRERELRLVKELFHATAEARRAHLVSVVGIAGIGKSRLAWEFEKYIDGLQETVRWHRGRCLAYGEGVTYWALAEMVRGRAGILEGEEPETALAKLSEAVEQHVPDPEERQWIEPRLAQLLGLQERVASDPQDLVGAWRRFFEQLSEQHPTVLVFEDLQWADTALLDFVDYLLDWSRSHPLFVLTLARPELAERRPGWAAPKPGVTSLYLEPLSQGAMRKLLDGLVPGLPVGLRDQILERAEGVPLYAVETVRMLLDRGLLVAEGNTYRPTGPIEALEVPETLHGLIAARLDGLTAVERRLLQDAAVLGKTFTSEALAALSGLPELELEPLLASLVHKELLSIQADPRSPERGQYGFVQELVRTVAYAALARKDRAARHLAAAAWLESSWGAKPEEIVEVLAAHCLEAYRAVPGAPDAAELKAKARGMLVRAAERAAALAASEEAQRYFGQAAELADRPLDRAGLLERAGEMAWTGGRGEAAVAHFSEAIALFESQGRAHSAVRVSARLGEVDWVAGRLEQGLERMETAFQVLAVEETDEDLASLAAQLGRLHFFKGDFDLAAERVEVALDIAESRWLPEVLSQALSTKSGIIEARGRSEEALALVTHALKVALENDLPSAALRAYANLSDSLCRHDRYDEALEQDRRALALARKVGNRIWEWLLIGELTYALFLTGGWEEAASLAAEVPQHEAAAGITKGWAFLGSLLEIHLAQGNPGEARRLLARFAALEASAVLQEHALHAAARAAVLHAEGRHADALAAGEAAFQARGELGADHQVVKAGFVWAVEAAFALADLGKVEELLAAVDELPPGHRSPLLQAQAARVRARLAAAHGDLEGVEAGFKAATGMLRELGVPFWLGVTLLEHGEWLARDARAEAAEPLFAEARAIFERLGARPWLERLGVHRTGLQHRISGVHPGAGIRPR